MADPKQPTPPLDAAEQRARDRRVATFECAFVLGHGGADSESLDAADRLLAAIEKFVSAGKD